MAEYLSATLTSAWGVIGHVSTLVWLVEMMATERKWKVPKVRPSYLLVVMFFCYSAAQYQQWAKLNAQLHPPIELYERHSGQWRWEGKPYSGDPLKLDEQTKLETTVNEPQWLNPAIKAPEGQSLEDVWLFLTFPRGVEVKADKPWVPQGDNSRGGYTYSIVIPRINRGVIVNGPTVLFFKPSAVGPVAIEYAVRSENASPVDGHFNVRVIDAPMP